MPWRCPACGTPIHHTEALPNPAVTYRCQVCRIELRLDDETGKLAVVPFPEEIASPRRRRDP
jgi:rubredoxin